MVERTVEDLVDDFEHRARAILGSIETEAADGRVAIRLRNQEKVIAALIALVVEGKAGTIDEIVERSGVARRTIFRHFTDVSELMLAAMRSVVADSAPLALLKDVGVGPLDQRIESFVDTRLRTLARMHPFRSGANARLAELDAVRAGVRATTEMLRVQISKHFAEELRMIGPVHAEHVIDGIYVVSSYESFDISVAQIGSSTATVRAAWIHAISRLLMP